MFHNFYHILASLATSFSPVFFQCHKKPNACFLQVPTDLLEKQLHQLILENLYVSYLLFRWWPSNLIYIGQPFALLSIYIPAPQAMRRSPPAWPRPRCGREPKASSRGAPKWREGPVPRTRSSVKNAAPRPGHELLHQTPSVPAFAAA